MADSEASPAAGSPASVHTASPKPQSQSPAASPEKSPSPQPSPTPPTENPHIPPPDRKLGRFQNTINEPVSHLEDIDSVDFQLRKAVGLTIQSSKNKPGFSEEVLDEITDLTRQYMHSFIDSLHRLTEVQRHHVPGIADLEMCFLMHDISPSGLYEEYQRTQRLDPQTKATAHTIKVQLDDILREYNAEHYNLDKEDPSLVFHANEQYEIAALVPRQNRPRDYIPAYFPDLPPDFTYTSTGDYMKTVSELKEIKVKLADESRLNEVSLYKLIDDDEARWNSAFEHALEGSESSESENDEIMSLAGYKDGSDADSPVPELLTIKADSGSSDLGNGSSLAQKNSDSAKSADSAEPSTDIPSASAVSAVSATEHPQTAVTEQAKNRFDFVEYARKRRLAKERYAVEIERRRKLREKNIFMKAETVYSASAKKVATREDREYFEHVLENRFKKVIKATRKAEATKVASLKALIEKKRLEEKEKEQSNGVYEFGFNFDAQANLSDDSDDEMQDVAFNDQPIVFDEEQAPEDAMEFNFGDEANLEDSDNGELADMEAELAADGLGMDEAGMESPAVSTGQVAGKAPLKTTASSNMQESGSVSSQPKEEDQAVEINNEMWGSDLDSDELQDLE